MRSARPAYPFYHDPTPPASPRDRTTGLVPEGVYTWPLGSFSDEEKVESNYTPLRHICFANDRVVRRRETSEMSSSITIPLGLESRCHWRY